MWQHACAHTLAGDGNSDVCVQPCIVLVQSMLFKSRQGSNGLRLSPLRVRACRKVQATQLARETLEAVAAQGKLGQAGRGAKVIYAQTDSIFASFPNATAQEAIQVRCQVPLSNNPVPKHAVHFKTG